MLEYKASEPADAYGSTQVVFTTDAGNISAHWLDGSHVHCAVGRDDLADTEGHLTVKVKGRQAFTVDGTVTLYAISDWDDVNPADRDNARNAQRGISYRRHTASLSRANVSYDKRDTLTPGMKDAVVSEVRAIIRDYIARHPQVIAHAQTRAVQCGYARATREVVQARQALCEARRLAASLSREFDRAGNAELREAVTAEIKPYYDSDSHYVPSDWR